MFNQNIKFISLEGIEGCGKSTQATKLYEHLLNNQVECIITREPGGCEAGEKIRNILLDDKIPALEARSELLLNFASRVEHYEKTIKPALRAGKIVICDRFIDSTYAYQGSAMGLGFEMIRELQHLMMPNIYPDITFLINVTIEEAFARIAKRHNNNRYEKLGKEFHRKVNDGFLQLATNNNRIKIIDGAQNQENVFQQILTFINQS